jgi:hypothetical protein
MTTHSRRWQTTFSLQRELQTSHSIDLEYLLGKCYCTQVAKNQFHTFKRVPQFNSWKFTKVQTKNSVNWYIKCANYFHLQWWECWWPAIRLHSITSQTTSLDHKLNVDSRYKINATDLQLLKSFKMWLHQYQIWS